MTSNFGLPLWLRSKESACQCRRDKRCRFDPWVGKIPWRRKYNPLQFICLGNPTDRGIWWATVHGVTQSDTTERLIHTHTNIISPNNSKYSNHWVHLIFSLQFDRKIFLQFLLIHGGQSTEEKHLCQLQKRKKQVHKPPHGSKCIYELYFQLWPRMHTMYLFKIIPGHGFSYSIIANSIFLEISHQSLSFHILKTEKKLESLKL